MTDSLADIDALALKCRAERSRDYIAESIQCYRAGAYRSSIVHTWIAVVFDLVDKIRELALANDPIAVRINTQYETYITQINQGNDQGVKNALEFERTILSTCRRELSFFNHQQITDLERLREDRHHCAHPSFQRAGVPHRPSAELARLHLRNAVEHVLSQPPIQGRPAIAEIIVTIASEYFPKDRHQATTALRQTPLANPSDALVRGLVDELVFKYTEADSPLHGKLQVGAALSSLLDTHRGVAEPRIAQKLSTLVQRIDDNGLPAVARLIAAVPEAVHLIDEAARLRLSEFVRLGPDVDVLPAMTGLGRHPLIDEIVRRRILGFGTELLVVAIQEYGMVDLVKERVFGLISESGNYHSTNDVFLRLVTPLFSHLTRDDIERVIRMPTETTADLVGARGFEQFIVQVSRTGIIPETELDTLLVNNRMDYLVQDR